MSALRFSARTEGEEALAAATPETLIQVVAPANHRVKLLGFSIAFDGTSPTAAPVLVELLRQTTAGTASAGTPRKMDDSIAETIQSTAQHSFTAEPTAGDILEEFEIHPQSGYEKFYPFGQEVIVGGGDRLGLRATAPAAVNAVATLYCEE